MEMDKNQPSKAEAAADIHQALAEKVGVDRDGCKRPKRWSWIVPAIVSALVALAFFGSLAVEESGAATQTAFSRFLTSARYISEDIVTVLESQVLTLGTIAAFALIPGIFGLIYRKKFWPWFLGAFGVLFAVNLAGFLTGTASVSKALVDDLNYSGNYWAYFAGETVLLGLLLVFRLRRHTTLGHGSAEKHRRKNIVVCLDGTWNHPGQTDWGHLAQTNVFKLFDSLEETPTAEFQHFNAARCKRYEVDSVERQVAFYYNGVGNRVENSVLGEMVGGAFGLGAEAIKERAYLDVAREYEPGDRIFIFGFSRGAALARMLASTLDKRGVPRSVWTLRLFGRQRPVKTSEEHVAASIAVLGCWDTVGAFGVSKDILGIPFQRVNLLKDLTVPLSVRRAYHLVALDEDRDSFVPTLMDPDPVEPGRIVEVWFSGNHSNVGGGFATDGLSDHTLSFMLERVSSAWDPETQQTTNDKSWGLYMTPGRTLRPNPLGKLRVSGGDIYTRFPRQLPIGATIHDSVFRRIRDDESDYVPDSLFVVNNAINKLREKLGKEVLTLTKTKSLTEAEAQEVEDWVDRRLTIRKWSKAQYAIDPAAELGHTTAAT